MFETNGFDRREFLKLGGLAAVALPVMTKVGSAVRHELLASPEAYASIMEGYRQF